MAILKRDEVFVPETSGDEVHTVLGEDSFFEGKLSFEGTVRIDGRFKGDIETEDTLIVGPKAHIEATLVVGSIVVNGHITGDILAQHSIELHAPARVVGTLSTPQLIISKGVVFEGTCKMEDALKNMNNNKLTLITSA